jgi:acetylornithine/succinyldiaminopimelate/putrescine aminotransferase/FAD/FMN-containing dehydrogenase
MSEGYDFSQKRIFGWSNTNSSYSIVTTPETVEEIRTIIQTAKNNGQKVLGRGAGQSYGDESLNEGQVLIDTSRMNRILEWNRATGVLRVQAGATYSDVLNRCLKDNWALVAIPGTRYVTMGGALANNVHGKNSFKQGNFGEWVKEFDIVLASGEQVRCSKESNSDLFFAAIGGAGLLGIVTEMTLQLVRIPSPYLAIKKSTASSLNELMDELDKATEKNDFVIAQVDCFPKSLGLGRGTMHAGNFISNNLDQHSIMNDVEAMRNISFRMLGVFPKKWVPTIGKYTLNNYTMRLVSRLKYYLDKLSSREKPSEQDIFRFTFLLDDMPNWKQVFRHGFFEYQPLIPKEKARAVIPQLIALTHEYAMPAYLSAIKVHRKDSFLLSYSLDGYSFAMDIPRHPGQKGKQDELFRKMNKIVITAGGIIYLAKDAHLTASEFRQMYKNVDQFLALKKKYDPSGVFESDMYRRIFLMTNKNNEQMNSNAHNGGGLLTLRESLDLEQSKANELYKKHVNSGLLGVYELLGLNNLDARSAEGVFIRLKDGRNILDFTSAIGIIGLGHNHPRITAAEKLCLDEKILNAIKLGPHKLQSALAYNLAALLPHPLSVSFFTTSGAEAVEAAMKLCERVQGNKRRKFITTGNSYHGKTHTALSMTRSGHMRDGFIQGIPEENVIEVPYGNAEALENTLKEYGDEVVAIIVEPIQGQSIETPPRGYLSAVVDICRKNNVLVIFDEVKSGMSRSGTFCAFQDESVVPDVVTLSKSLGGGSRAMGAMITSEELFKKAYGKREASSLHTTTFGGLGHSCAVAIEALNILGDLDFQKNVREKGDYLKKSLEDLQERYPNKIVAVKGRGLMQAIQFNFRNIFKDSSFQIPALPLIDTFDKVMMASLIRALYEKHNILAHFADSNIDTLHVMPPLIVEKEHIDKFVEAVDTILKEGFISLATNFVKEVMKDKLA